MKQKSFKQLVNVIKTGNPAEVKAAQKEIGKQYNRMRYPLTESQKQEYRIFLTGIKEFDRIEDINHQAYFINTLKWPLLVISEENYQIFADFIIRQIQNPSGKIRQAIINSVDWLLISSATFNLESIFSNPTKEQTEKIQQNKKRFCLLTSKIEKLIRKYHEPRFNKYKYVNSIPPSIYKSLQILITEHLLPTEHQEKIYREYQRKTLLQDYIPSSELVDKRLEIEQELSNLLREHKSPFALEDIKKIIYNENESDDLMKVVRIFDQGGDVSELENILNLATDAWNYFPHKALNDLSPQEVIESHKQELVKNGEA